MQNTAHFQYVHEEALCEREMNRDLAGKKKKKENTTDIIQEAFNGHLSLGPQD